MIEDEDGFTYSDHFWEEVDREYAWFKEDEEEEE